MPGRQSSSSQGIHHIETLCSLDDLGRSAVPGVHRDWQDHCAALLGAPEEVGCLRGGIIADDERYPVVWSDIGQAEGRRCREDAGGVEWRYAGFDLREQARASGVIAGEFLAQDIEHGLGYFPAFLAAASTHVPRLA